MSVPKLTHHFYIGDAREVLSTLPAESVDCCVTSPPYWNLRNYLCEGQIGLEKTPEEFVARLVEVFREVWRVLKPTASFWLNIGDSFNGSGGAGGDYGPGGIKEGQPKYPGRHAKGVRSKSLCLIPHRVAIAMLADGWILRNQVVWYKRNAIPCPHTDRLTIKWEPVFHFVKEPQYFYDLNAIRVPWEGNDFRQCPGKPGKYADKGMHKLSPEEYRKWYFEHRQKQSWHPHTADDQMGFGQQKRGHKIPNLPHPDGKNPGDVWSIPTAPFPEAHYATFPEALVERPLKATCPVGGVVLDPFGGAGTVNLVAKKLGRNSIYVDLNPDYAAMAVRRCGFEQGGLFEEHVCEVVRLGA